MTKGFFKLAQRQADQSLYKIKVGAVLSGKRPLSVGHNKLKTHPQYADPERHTKISIHAEIDCLIKSDTSVTGDTIWVFRYGKDGNPGLARPCVDCMRELKSFGIKKIYYSVDHAPYWKFERME